MSQSQEFQANSQRPKVLYVTLGRPLGSGDALDSTEFPLGVLGSLGFLWAGVAVCALCSGALSSQGLGCPVGCNGALKIQPVF